MQAIVRISIPLPMPTARRMAVQLPHAALCVPVASAADDSSTGSCSAASSRAGATETAGMVVAVVLLWRRLPAVHAVAHAVPHGRLR